MDFCRRNELKESKKSKLTTKPMLNSSRTESNWNTFIFQNDFQDWTIDGFLDLFSEFGFFL